MLAPTPEEITAAKAECRRRFGHEKIVRVIVTEPIATHALVAAFNLTEASSYVDNRRLSFENARSSLIGDRCLWPSQEVLEEIRGERRLWAVDIQIENKFRELMGFSDGEAHARPLSAATAPPGFRAGLNAKDLAAKVAELVGLSKGQKLFAVQHPSNGLELIMGQPTGDVGLAASVALAAAQKSGSGTLTAVLDFAIDHVVWSPPGGAKAHIDEAPGRATDIAQPFFEMGGAGASASASFL